MPRKNKSETDDLLSERPAVNSESQRELDKVEAQFQKFDQECKDLTHDRLNQTPREESGRELEISTKEREKSKDIYLKPKRSLYAVDPKTGQPQKFNERFRKEYEFQKEYVNFVFQNNELIGETTSMWTHPFGGMPAEEWEVPCNKSVWGPRYLAEQIKRKFYHRLRMEDKTTGSDGTAQYYGTMVVDTTIQRLDAHPVSNRKSIFMGASGF